MIHKSIEIVVDNYKARLTTYILDNFEEIDSDRTRPMVIVIPGGGYRHVSDREAEPIAIQMNAMGFHACVLKYSVYPAQYPTALVQLAKAVTLVREHAQEWGVRPDRIILTGFSAGGHLAASLGTLWNEEFLEQLMETDQKNYKPDGMILSYPVITSGQYAHHDSFHGLLQERHDELAEAMSLEKRVTKETPPAFIWHTFEDGLVPVENSMLFASALRKQDIPFELHIYPNGAHGLSLSKEETKSCKYPMKEQPECQNWISMAGIWIQNL